MRRRAVAGVKRAFGEELSELETPMCFLHLSSEFCEPLFTSSSTGTPHSGVSLGSPSLWLLSLGDARESDQLQGCPLENETSPGSTTRRLKPAPGLPPAELIPPALSRRKRRPSPCQCFQHDDFSVRVIHDPRRLRRAVLDPERLLVVRGFVTHALAIDGLQLRRAEAQAKVRA